MTPRDNHGFNNSSTSIESKQRKLSKMCANVLWSGWTSGTGLSSRAGKLCRHYSDWSRFEAHVPTFISDFLNKRMVTGSEHLKKFSLQNDFVERSKHNRRKQLPRPLRVRSPCRDLRGNVTDRTVKP